MSVLLELIRLENNRSWFNAIIKDFNYLQEHLSNTHIFKSLIGKSVFDDCRLTDYHLSSTDFESLVFRNSAMIGGTFGSAEIKKAIFRNSSIINTKFKNTIIGPGHIDHTTMFEGCSFKDVTFYSMELSNMEFKRCNFTRCTFSACSFSGCDSLTVQDYVTQNRFISCVLQDTSFDYCSFNTREGAYGVKIVKKCEPSPSVAFHSCKGSIKFNNTVCKTGLNTQGFVGDISFSNSSTATVSTYVCADDVDEDDDYEIWNSLIDVSGTCPVIEEAKEIKNRFPIRYMSKGL